MEKTPNSRKRRHPSSQPFQGIFTRSRFELFIHRNRSGRGRTDPSRRRKLSADIEIGRFGSSGRIPIDGSRPTNDSFNESSLTSIKDLRTRRVFSPASVDGESSPEKKSKIRSYPDEYRSTESDELQMGMRFDGEDCFEEQKIDVGVAALSGSGEGRIQTTLSSDCTSLEAVDVEREVGFDRKECYGEGEIGGGSVAVLGEEFIHMTSEMSNGRSPEAGNVEFDGEVCYNEQEMGNGIEAISGGVDGLDEEIIQMTPPNSERGSPTWGNLQREVGFDGEKKIDDSGIEANLRIVDSLGEEWIQSTPPDDDIFCKSDVQEGRGNGMGINTMIDADRIVENPSTVRNSGENPSDDEGSVRSKKDAANSMMKNRKGLVPCSRLKLFQTPNSLAYRRLLPFLMDLAKDNASSLEIRSCKNLYSAKFEKMVGERPHSQLLDSRFHAADLGSGKANKLYGQHRADDLGTPIADRSMENRLAGLGTALTENPKENSIDGLSSHLTENQKEKSPDVLKTSQIEKSNEKSVDAFGVSVTEKLKEMSHVGFETPPADKTVEMCHAASLSDSSTTESQTLVSFEEHMTESPIQEDTVNSISLYDPPISMPPDSCTETVSQPDQVIAMSSCKLDLGHDAVGSMIKIEVPYESSSISSTCHEALSMECANNIQEPPNLSRKVEVECTTQVYTLSTDAKPVESLNLQLSSQCEASVHLETPVLAPMRGILKTYSRECRGLCTCPDCALFRLHAEKANEFSRKQMQDAEEVAVELMKELSCLRSLMEKSIAPSAASVRDQAIVQVNQIKGFCRRASRAEVQARNRLREMSHDLSTHCRITTLQRPKVRFADNLEEKLILEFEKEEDL